MSAFDIDPRISLSAALLTVLSWHLLSVKIFESFIKSCSIDYGNGPSPKSEVVHEAKI